MHRATLRPEKRYVRSPICRDDLDCRPGNRLRPATELACADKEVYQSQMAKVPTGQRAAESDARRARNLPVASPGDSSTCLDLAGGRI